VDTSQGEQGPGKGYSHTAVPGDRSGTPEGSPGSMTDGPPSQKFSRKRSHDSFSGGLCDRLATWMQENTLEAHTDVRSTVQLAMELEVSQPAPLLPAPPRGRGLPFLPARGGEGPSGDSGSRFSDAIVPPPPARRA